MKTYLLFTYFIISLLVFSCKQATSNKNLTNLSPEQFQTALKNNSVQLIDVRTPKEYDVNHIQNAVNVDFFSDDFSKNINEFDKEQPIFIYCRSGRRSAKSAIEFQKAGFTKIYNLEGGFLNWKSKGF
ncbi:Rhodanese-related sulfurtransferase [Flaviramulus basaltis]|uniref:Rhodanese-related sulfurtransferase n=1 Tax=Flaviramulus basaltis TaxID=369401 RepID=A0A1K2IK34_9FLAO|nr:rhodanese-like domain-containing protein [Flaviramulus basaltis]SFZ92772.1 Rhodanese-related sulfurtransferase [Flaviramulus basaltis]